MRLRVVLSIMVLSILCLAIVGTAFAADPGTQGQPSQTCGSATALMTPGNAMSSPGSAFNPNGVADAKYAGTQPQNSNNPSSVSQYDVACFQVSQGH